MSQSSQNSAKLTETTSDEVESSFDVGIIGAGPAGAGAAYALCDSDATVTVLEKSGGVCGRAATRRKNGCRYDHGANYIKDADPRTAELIPTLGTEELVDIDEPVWTFDETGEITEGDSRDEHKWTWTEGMTQLAKRLFAETDVNINHRTRVADISRVEKAWTLTDTDNTDYGPFDALLLTPPAPQTVTLLEATAWQDTRLETLMSAAADVEYRTIRTVVLHYPFMESYPWYGLVNVDKEHPVGWLSREECKDGHVPAGESLFIAQMSPEWSTNRYDDPVDVAGADTASHVAALLDDERYENPDWIDDQGWRYALPENGIDNRAARVAESAGLYVAGDWIVGEGRVNKALWNGYDTGTRIANALSLSQRS